MTSIMGTSSAFSQYKKIDQIAGNKATGNFQDLLKDSLKDAAQAVRSNEKMVSQGVFKQTDLTTLSTETAQLDVMISTLTALRDKVVATIQEIQKMPI